MCMYVTEPQLAVDVGAEAEELGELPNPAGHDRVLSPRRDGGDAQGTVPGDG